MAKRGKLDHPGYNLLTTKLDIPLLSAHIVRRERLTAILKRARERRVILLVAPTGYGKTTLLVEWLSTRSESDRRTIWITLDPFDNAPLRLWSYIAIGLKKVHPALKFNPHQMIQRGFDPTDCTLLNPLLNEIARIPHTMDLVLDDYQSITDTAVHDSLSYLIEHQPANLHLILSSRVTPPIPLTRLRASRQLLVINAGDLAFTLPEVESFLTNVVAVQIPPDQVLALYDATEGWIGGLQLASLSCQSQSKIRVPQADALRDNGQILEYLAEEVLNHLDPDLTEFLLKSSILRELSAPLCDAVLARTDSRELIARVEQANLFLVSLDDHQGWYRYHQLFAEALRVHLQRTYPSLIAELHRRACTWLLEHGSPDAAVAHALSAGDLEQAGEIVDALAIQAISRYDMTSVIRWISHFSDRLIAQRPRLGVYDALAKFHLGRIDQVESSLVRLEQILTDAPACARSPEEERYVRWAIAALRAVIASLNGDQAGGIARIRELLTTLPRPDLYFTGFLNFTLAESCAATGELAAAAEAFEQGAQWAARQGHPIAYVQAMSEAARVYKKQGRLALAERRLEQALHRVTQFDLDAGLAALVQAGLAEIAIERNDLEAAAQRIAHVVNSYADAERSPAVWSFLELISARLVRYSLAIGDMENACRHYDKLGRCMEQIREPFPDLLWDMIDVQVPMWLTMEKREPGGCWRRQIEALLDLKGTPRLAEQAAQARIHLARHHLEPAQAMLERLAAISRKLGAGERLIETLMRLALVYRELGQADRAFQALGEALLLAEPEGYIRLFVDEGEPMKDLLCAYLAANPAALANGTGGDAPGFARRLVAAMEAPPAPPAPLIESLPPTAELHPVIEPLSPRKREVLRLLVGGKSVKEIGATLTISVNTAKVHIKNIYRKLGSHSRQVVFERAAEMKLG